MAKKRELDMDKAKADKTHSTLCYRVPWPIEVQSHFWVFMEEVQLNCRPTASQCLASDKEK